jgi:hypothetical protein
MAMLASPLMARMYAFEPKTPSVVMTASFPATAEATVALSVTSPEIHSAPASSSAGVTAD